MKVVAIVQSRCGSSRLPMKAVRVLAGRPMLEHVLERVAATAGLDAVVLATSTVTADDVLPPLAARLGVPTWRGSEIDVLGRLRDAANFAQADVIMRVTGDCPFWDPEVGAQVLGMHLAGSAAYTSNDTRRGQSGFPDGLDTEVFTRTALEMAHFATCDQACATAHERHHDREHVTAWLLRQDDVVKQLVRHTDQVDLKLSVDSGFDYDFACAIAARLDRGDYRLASTLRAARAVRHA